MDEEEISEHRQSRTRSAILLHFVWSVKYHSDYFAPELERRVHRCISAVALEQKCHVLAIGGMPDHVHLFVQMPTQLSPTVLMKQVKGASSKMVNEIRKEWTGVFSWQDGYAVFSVSSHDKAKDQVIAYINNQKEHHSTGRLHPEWDDLVALKESPIAPKESPTTEGRSAESSKNHQGSHLAAGFNLSETHPC
jgi:putative transposase